MANMRRAKADTSRHLTVVDDSAQSENHALAELRAQLAAAGAPAEVLRMLDEPGDPDEIVARLIDSGMLPSPGDALAGMLSAWTPLLRPRTGPLDAELFGVEFVGMLRAGAPDPDDVPPMLTELVGQVQAAGTPEAVAMLRVFAVLGPADVRPAAATAADELVAVGLPDPAWARGLGRPEVGACFGYRDDCGAQESIAVTFRYGRKQHALVVLIDHDLGGGIKDCFPSDRPDRARADFQRAARRFALTFQDYSPAQAGAILAQALQAPPCPAAPDQVEDVHLYLDLLRARYALLANDEIASTTTTTHKTTTKTVHRVKITLRGVKPPIWRRLEVPSTINLRQLHQTIQDAFGWEGYHLWVFSTASGDYGIPDPELQHRDAARARLDRVAPRAGGRLDYTYDFGDDWEHDIVVEDVLTAEPGVAYPRCLAGRQACPPEDCGGTCGYAELLDVMANPDHPEHSSMLEWLGLGTAEEFHPAAFDRAEINKRLSTLATVLARGRAK